MPKVTEKFWNMTKNAAKNSAEITIYGTIGTSWWEESVSASQFSKDLKDLGDDIDDITVRVNSGGGSVFDGLAIRSLLKNHKASITVHVDGWAASIASIIAMAGDKIIMAKGSMMMIHNPASGGWGEAKDLREIADFLDKVRDSLVSVYVSRTGLSNDELIEMMDSETWMSAEEAVEKGFADEVDETSIVAANMKGAVAMVNGVTMDYSHFTKAPKLPVARTESNRVEEGAKTTPVSNTINGGGKKLTLEELKNQHPDLYAQVVAAGVEQERTRMQALDELAAPGNADIIAQAKATGSSAAETAVAIIKAENEKRKKVVAQIKNDSDESGVNNVEAETPEETKTKEQKEKEEVEANATGLVNAFKRARGVK